MILLAQEVARRDDATHHLVPDVIRLAEGVGFAGRLLEVRHDTKWAKN